MTGTVIKTGNRPKFSREDVCWYVGVEFVLELIFFGLFLILLYDSFLVVSTEFDYAYMNDMLSLTVHVFYMLVVSLALGITAFVKCKKNKPDWRRWLTMDFSFSMTSLSWIYLLILLMCDTSYMDGIADLYPRFADSTFCYCLRVLAFLLFVWNLIWMIRFYRMDQMRFWNWKSFGCRMAGFLLAVLSFVLLSFIPEVKCICL